MMERKHLIGVVSSLESRQWTRNNDSQTEAV
jgi:hypothetical protein